MNLRSNIKSVLTHSVRSNVFWWLAGMLLLLAPNASMAGKRKRRPVLLSSTGLRVLFHPRWPHQPTEFEIRAVDRGSPADGVGFKVGDRVVGIGDEKFNGHPAGALVKAIDYGEANHGKLPLLLKTGKKVVVNLEKLGAYSPTAPYNCRKTDKIIARTAEELVTYKGLGGTPTRTGLLGLMATGEKKYIDVVAKKIRNPSLIKPDAKAIDDYLKNGGPMGMVGWTWGYNLICLGEYYLLTKDESVLPAMRIYALALARGQDPVGLWGHRMARGGRAPGYGIMNQPSLSNFMGMLFAAKCGVKDPALDKAIKKTHAYVTDHIGKGGFPYGVHGPGRERFNNNGTSGSAAICMALKGNQKGAAYFSRIAAPTHGQLTYGHASHFFNPLWTPLGASLAGPEVTQKFFKRSLWYFNGKRHWKGGFPEKDKAGFVAGQALLTYCLPRKALFITGREADESIWVKGSEADRIIMMKRIDYSKKSADELFKLFNSPYSQVRIKAIAALRKKLNWLHRGKKTPPPDPMTTKLLALVKNGNERQRISALSVLGGCHRQIATPQAKLFGAIVRDKKEPLIIRVAAASAFGHGNCGDSGEAVYPYYNDILRLILEKRTEPDPFGHIDSKIARALDGIHQSLRTPESKKGLVVDNALRYKAADKLMDHKRQKVRQTGIKLLKNISLENFHIVGDKLMHVLGNRDPSYHTYSSTLNADGILILANLNIKEGLDILEHGIFHGDGKWGFRIRALINALPAYGASAEPYIAKFEAHPGINKKGDRFTSNWRKAVKKIREDKSNRKLITVEEAKLVGKKKYNREQRQW